jgi:hypothetical protein
VVPTDAGLKNLRGAGHRDEARKIRPDAGRHLRAENLMRLGDGEHRYPVGAEFHCRMGAMRPNVAVFYPFSGVRCSLNCLA